MTQKDMIDLREELLSRRREIFDRVRERGAGRQEFQREVELVEEAQKLALYEPFDQLDERAKREIEEIDLALNKMAVGSYGICESCGDPIAIGRLKAVPWTRLCRDCAQEYERRRKTLPPAAEMMEEPIEIPEEGADVIEEEAELPEEFEGMGEAELVEAVMDRLQSDGRLELQELKLSVDKGRLILEGVVPSTREHQILLQILSDILGFNTIIDRLEISEWPWEREDRTGEPAPAGPTLEDRMFQGEEEISEDMVEADSEEMPYAPADRPLPEGE